MIYQTSPEEPRLLREYDEASRTRRALGWSVGGAIILGLFLMPVGLLLWALAFVLGIAAGRTTTRIGRIRHKVAELRTFPNPKAIKSGVPVSLIPSPFGLSGDRLVGLVGSFSEEDGDAEIVSEPLGGRQHVGKVSGSFDVARGDWVRFHREADGSLTIWDAGTSYGDLVPVDGTEGTERQRRAAQLHKLAVAQGRAAAALKDLLEASGVVTESDNSKPAEERPPEGGEPQVWTKDRIISHFGISEDYFSVKYMSYDVALRASGMSSHWNDDVDALARSRSALTEAEITLAHTDLNQAILNRVKLALAMQEGHRNRDG